MKLPRHKPLRMGTLGSIVNEIAVYLEIERQKLGQELFG